MSKLVLLDDGRGIQILLLQDRIQIFNPLIKIANNDSNMSIHSIGSIKKEEKIIEEDPLIIYVPNNRVFDSDLNKDLFAAIMSVTAKDTNQEAMQVLKECESLYPRVQHDSECSQFDSICKALLDPLHMKFDRKKIDNYLFIYLRSYATANKIQLNEANKEWYVKMVKKLRCNAYVGPAKSTVLYKTASYFNHSCTPSADYFINENGTISITALRDIQTGEEITISYIDGVCSKEEVMKRFGFKCKCPLCAERKDR